MFVQMNTDILYKIYTSMICLYRYIPVRVSYGLLSSLLVSRRWFLFVVCVCVCVHIHACTCCMCMRVCVCVCIIHAIVVVVVVC